MNARHDARYGRQTMLPEVGNSGQAKLAATRALVVGVGGLGCPASLYLATTGFGHLTIVDHDRVDLTNLHRQVLYGETDLGKLKAECAQRRLAALGTGASIHCVTEAFSESNALRLVSSHDLVLDCSDNFRTRYLVGDACALTGIPLVSAAISRFDAQMGIFSHEGSPCYRCAFPELPAPGKFLNCAAAGVLAPFVGMVGVMQALEATNLVLGISSLVGKILFFNGLSRTQFEVTVEQNADCPVCSRENAQKLQTNHFSWCAELPAEEGCGLKSDDVIGLDPDGVRTRLFNNPSIALVDVRTRQEFTSGRLPGSLNCPSEEILQHGVFALAAQGIGRESEVILYCATGKRSLACVEFLRSQGFSSVHHMAGGIFSQSVLRFEH